MIGIIVLVPYDGYAKGAILNMNGRRQKCQKYFFQFFIEDQSCEQKKKNNREKIISMWGGRSTVIVIR